MRNSVKVASLILLSCSFGMNVAAQPASAKSGTLAITGGKLLTVSHGTIENGVLVIVDGKISAVGEAGKVTVPAGAAIVDAHGLTVYPGLIDPDTTLG
jgi:imidazolonepropionase-like amidohydrolase